MIKIGVELEVMPVFVSFLRNYNNNTMKLPERVRVLLVLFDFN